MLDDEDAAELNESLSRTPSKKGKKGKKDKPKRASNL
jgi:hypothetical protein